MTITIIFIAGYYILTSVIINNKADSKVISSKLPMLLINTFGEDVKDEPKIGARITIINNKYNKINYITDIPENELNVGIEIRGNISKVIPKKSYGFEIRDNNNNDLSIPVFGFPKGSDWVLYGPYSDKTLMRNFLTLTLGRQMGMYASRAKFVEVYFKDYNNSIEDYEYKGIFVLLEKVKHGKNRVNITKTKNTKREIPCSFILEIVPESRMDSSMVYSKSKRSGRNFVYIYPKQLKVTETQKTWIMNYINSFEDELTRKNFDPETGYQKYIDINSFVDYLILNDFVKNNDAFYASTFIYKDINDKMKAGPPWDYNFSMGNNKYQEPESGWFVKNNSEWVKMLFQDSVFRKKYRKRWFELRNNVLSHENINGLIDSTYKLLSEAQKKNFERWPILGRKVWPNRRPVPKTYDAEIDALKSWIDRRLNWMDADIEKLN
ncbi:MAG: hypothetical protein B6D61_05465 [Bacteroidetes bacterium 4484_249]|nr:MAG: hypothetical protein B6D61_05465 [Bacteroidetes bacterium 4484_249]